MKLKVASKTRIFLIPIILIICLGAITLIFSMNSSYDQTQNKAIPKVKIGYFHGEHSDLLYKAYINKEFEKENVTVALITRDLYSPKFYTVPNNPDIKEIGNFVGKATGIELIESVINGDFDGAVAGGSSFIKAVSEGAPIVAVAMLGHYMEGRVGHAILFRKDVIINRPEDIKGKILATRRSGPGDKVFLREYLQSIGLDYRKDVIILDDVMGDKLRDLFKSHQIDGGYFHLRDITDLVGQGYAYIYRKLDWIDPELSNAVLVFHKDFVKEHPAEVEKIVRAYIKIIQSEQGFQKENSALEGFGTSTYDFPPYLLVEPLEQTQNLLLKHGYIDDEVDLSQFLDNSFAEKIFKQLN